MLTSITRLPKLAVPLLSALLVPIFSMRVAAGQRFEVFLALSGGAAEPGICAATGMLDRLQ